MNPNCAKTSKTAWPTRQAQTVAFSGSTMRHSGSAKLRTSAASMVMAPAANITLPSGVPRVIRPTGYCSPKVSDALSAQV